jgi:hypothetical protein
MELIIQIGTVLGAVGVIIGAVVKFLRFVKKLTDNINNVSTTLDDLKEHSNENYMSLLRLTIMSSEMPIGERIVAGHKYLNNGGNGEVKSFLKKEFNITDTVDEASHYKK